MFLDAIDHVQLAMPTGGEELATWFYAEVLGVPRVPKPPHLAVRGGCWFERGALRIHLGVQDDFVAATKAHPAFAVSDLARLEAHLASHGVLFERVDDPLLGPQLYAHDPFGNRIELRPARPTEPLAETWERIEASVPDDDVAARLRFVAELDRLRTVERQSLILDGFRRENSAEHSWHAAMLALTFADTAPDDVDVARVVQMLLVHDIVEIDAGDTGIHDTAHRETKTAREEAAADRLFGLLPAEPGARLRALWDEYEAGTSPDAVFAHVFDRFAPFLLNLTSGGLTWRRWGVTAADVREVTRPVGEGLPVLGEALVAMLDAAVSRRDLPSGSSGLHLPGAGDF